VEVHKYFDVNNVFDQFRQIAPTAGLSVGLFAGIEVPLVGPRKPPLLAD
jgi:hypothetical protein